MPTRCLKDVEGCFCKWGGQGKKYRYKCGDKEGKKRAKGKADTQGRAAHTRGYGKENKVIGGFRIN